MDFNDPKEFDDPQVFDDPKGISIGSMDFDNPKVYGDTFIFDGLATLDSFLLGEESFKIKPPLSTHRFYHSQLSPNHIRNTTTTFCSLNLGHPGAGGCGPLPNK